MPIIVPKVLISKKLTQGANISGANITIYYTGTLDFQITTDADAGSPTWDTVVLSTGIMKSHTFTTPGDQVMYRIVGSSGAIIQTQINDYGESTAPGIQIGFIYV